MGSENVIWDREDLPFSPRFEDHYFSRQDGIAETRHVFLTGNNLPERWREQTDFTIGELGFGTGLNFATTWHEWKRYRAAGQTLRFVSVDAFPLDAQNTDKALRRWDELAAERVALTNHWNVLGNGVALDQQTHLTVFTGLAEQMVAGFPKVDAWFLDGFAPDRNREMWSLDLLSAVAERTSESGTFATYTAAGWVRRNLAEAGFTVERQPGFGTKRHMSTGRLA